MLRLIGLLIILLYTATGAVLLVGGGEPGVQFLGLFFVFTGITWLAVDQLRRRGLI